MASLSLYVVTFNCGRTLVDVEALASQLLKGTNGTPPDLIFLSLQEIAPVYASFIGGSFLVPYFDRFQDAVRKATANLLGDEYELVTLRHVGMTALMAFARQPDYVKDIETAGVGVGVMEMGNKGAVGLRLDYQTPESSTTLTFVAAHLAAMESEIQRRNEDWKNIVRGLVFSSERGTSERVSGSEDEQPLLSAQIRKNTGIYDPTSHLFVAGDLNYRTSILKPGPEDHKTVFPQPNHSPESPKHMFSLLENDQLNQERLAGRTCQGLSEAEIKFPPTYKYSSDEPFLVDDEDLQKWNWASHRWPSWCDRVLYLKVPAWLKRQHPGVEVTPEKYTALPLMPTSDHRAVTSLFSIPLLPIPAPSTQDNQSDDPRVNPPFSINSSWKIRREKARQLELVVGFGAYFTTTFEGGAVAIATIMGIAGGFFALRLLMEF